MKKQVKVALIGCGRVASVHAQALSKLPHTELSAVVDIKPDRAEKFSELYDCNNVLTDYKEALADPEIDAVEICTPHYLHAPIAIDAARAGKHILTEKPMAISVLDADAMIHEAEKAGVKLGVIFQNRYNDASMAIKEAIDQGKLGKLLGTRMFLTWNRSDEYYKGSDWKGTWDKEGGGVLIDQAIHTMDLMQWFMGDIAEVEAKYYTRAHDFIQVDDVAEGTLKFANGAVGFIYANCAYPYDAPIFLEVYGDKGLAQLHGDVATIKIGNKTTTVVQQSDGIVGKRYWGFGHKLQISDFYEGVLQDLAPQIDGLGGKTAMAMVLAMYHSARSDAKVDFKRFLAGQYKELPA
jgi:UDP-N-acetyl-2-amino-2-deoxyglucuronate dehydrogenase